MLLYNFYVGNNQINQQFNISQFVFLINDKVKVYITDILGDMSTSTLNCLVV